jgi:hypothetical protein
MQDETDIQQQPVQASSSLMQRFLMWLHTIEGKLFGISVVVHVVLHALLLLLMPAPYYTGLLSGHDAGSYYIMAYDPFPAEPVESLMRYKRVAFSLVARALFPWDAHVGIALAAIIGAALANLYFYRLASLYLANPWRIALVFAFAPYLFAAAHVGVPDTLSIAFVLAALFYLLQDQHKRMIVSAALALLFKEVAAVAVFAMAVISFWRIGVVRTFGYFFLVGIPTLIVVVIYALVWNDPLWYLGESRMAAVPAPVTLFNLFLSPESTIHVRVSSVINMVVLALLAYGIWGLRKFDRTLQVYVVISILPLLFLDWRQYQSDFDMVRQYMVAAPALLPFSAFFNRLHYWIYRLVLIGMFFYALYYILSIGKFFVTYKEVILRLLPV